MKKINSTLVLRKDDYYVLISFLKGMWGKTASDRKNTEDLKAELKKAKLVNKENFPADVVRLDSRVAIKADDKNEIMDPGLRFRLWQVC